MLDSTSIITINKNTGVADKITTSGAAYAGTTQALKGINLTDSISSILIL